VQPLLDPPPELLPLPLELPPLLLPELPPLLLPELPPLLPPELPPLLPPELPPPLLPELLPLLLPPSLSPPGGFRSPTPAICAHPKNSAPPTAARVIALVFIRTSLEV
jgi:hypothetical protein